MTTLACIYLRSVYCIWARLTAWSSCASIYVGNFHLAAPGVRHLLLPVASCSVTVVGTNCGKPSQLPRRLLAHSSLLLISTWLSCNRSSRAAVPRPRLATTQGPISLERGAGNRTGPSALSHRTRKGKKPLAMCLARPRARLSTQLGTRHHARAPGLVQELTVESVYQVPSHAQAVHLIDIITGMPGDQANAHQ